MKKNPKSKPSPMPKIDPYLESVVAKLIDHLSVLERKMDVVISKVSQNAAGNKNVSSAVSSPQPQARREKTLYEAICADCSKVCEVPFRPTENRPVYCKECWAKRRGSGHGMPVLRPVALPPKPASKLGLPPEPAPASKSLKKTKKAKRKKT